MVIVADSTSDLEQIRCITGFCGTNREVTSFTIIDTPEILDRLHGGEFVVGSGYITNHNPSMLKGLIASFKEKGCAALGVKLHCYHNGVPGIILDDGNKLDFPIYGMPYNLYFCDFASMIYKRIFEEQLDDMYHVSIAYEDIVNPFSKYKVPERMLSELSLVLRNPVFLIDSRSEPMEYSYDPSDDFSLQNLLHKEVLMELDKSIQNTLLKKHQQQPYQFHQFSISSPKGEVDCILLSSGNIDGDTTFLVIPEINKLEDWHYRVVKDISTLFQLTANNRVNTQDSAAPVIMAQSDSNETILRYCKMYNFDYSKHRICLPIEFDSEVPTTSTRKYMTREIFSSITTWIMNACGCNVFFLKTRTHYVLYLFLFDVISQETAEYQTSEVTKKIQHIFNHNNIPTYIGVSLYSSNLQQISKAFFQAIDAMKLGRKLYPEEDVSLFRTIQVYQWLSTIPQESLEEMYRDIIEPLSKAGNSDVNYVHILRAYIGNHYSISKTASHLYIHRNTLMNHLTRIQEMLPYNIELPENMLKLQIGIHVIYLLDRNI